ncbi:MAG: ABC transporter permease [Candidatus Dependentiae bacterium]|nr:ABC transporter permease [Candidatus Dependentiae bacterium]
MKPSSQFARPWVLVATLLFFVFLYIPIVVLLAFSFNNAPFPAPWSGMTFRWYGELFRTPEAWWALFNSLAVSAASVFLSICMGIFLMFLSVRSSGVRRLLSYFYANLIFPEIVLAVGLLGLFTSCGVPLGMVTLTVAHTVLGLGYVVPLVQARYQELDPHLMEAAEDLGATNAQTFFTIILPLIKPALFTAGILAFIVSFDDFVFSYFCAGSTFQTLPLYILSMLRNGVSPIINALSTLLLFLSGALIILYSSYTTKMRRAR